MRRARVIIIAIFFALLGIILPVAAMLYLSWDRAIASEEVRLTQFAHRVIDRASLTINEGKGILLALDKLDTPPCSDRHIDQIRQMAMNAHSIEEIGYFKNGLLKCTSWGLIKSVIQKDAVDFITSDGFEVTVKMQPLVSLDSKMMAVHYGHYNILINPTRFVDVIAEPYMQFAIATTDNRLLASLNNPDPLFLKEILANPKSKLHSDYLVGIVREVGLIAIAIEPRYLVDQELTEFYKLFLPIGVLISMGMVWLVFWFSRRRLSPLGELKIAVENKEFIVHYQPIIELTSGMCIGAEALIRWERPDGIIINPNYFIPLAEENGLLSDITNQIIKQVIIDLQTFLVANKQIHIAINLCPDDIKTARFLPVLQAAMFHTGIETQQIWLEITERGFMDVEAARATLTQARNLGYKVAIDDFGTGYSSLSYLEGLPLDVLKIDKSFVDTIEKDSATSSVTPHIIDMAKTLGLKIIAEGIEVKPQADYLIQHKVEYGQGWLYSKALPAKEFIEYCQRK